jgi:hypothetical protein
MTSQTKQWIKTKQFQRQCPSGMSAESPRCENEEEAGENGKEKAPSQQVCLCFQKLSLLCITFSWNKFAREWFGRYSQSLFV